MSDAALKATIKVVGVIQPPTVSERDGALTIVYGSRRVRLAIELGLTEIDVLVKDPDDHDNMRGVVENVARAYYGQYRPLAGDRKPALQRTGRKTRSPKRSQFPCAKSANSVSFANVHPTILDQIGAGDMPRDAIKSNDRLRAARGSGRRLEEIKPKKGEGPLWWKIAQALEKTRFFAKDANSAKTNGPHSRSSGRRTCLRKGTRTTALLSTGRLSPPHSAPGSTRTCRRTASCLRRTNTAAKSCRRGPSRHGRSRKRATRSDSRSVPATARSTKSSSACPSRKRRQARTIEPERRGRGARAEENPARVIHKGTEIIGALRTEALVKALEANPVDDATLIGLLILALNARNVSIQTHGSENATRTKLR